jgi:hypothetical protein
MMTVSTETSQLHLSHCPLCRRKTQFRLKGSPNPMRVPRSVHRSKASVRKSVRTSLTLSRPVAEASDRSNRTRSAVVAEQPVLQGVAGIRLLAHGFLSAAKQAHAQRENVHNTAHFRNRASLSVQICVKAIEASFPRFRHSFQDARSLGHLVAVGF